MKTVKVDKAQFFIFCPKRLNIFFKGITPVDASEILKLALNLESKVLDPLGLLQLHWLMIFTKIKRSSPKKKICWFLSYFDSLMCLHTFYVYWNISFTLQKERPLNCSKTIDILIFYNILFVIRCLCCMLLHI